MEWNFGSFFIGIIVSAVGILVARFYESLGENLGLTIGSMQKLKLGGIIVAVGGLMYAFNIFNFVLDIIGHAITGN